MRLGRNRTAPDCLLRSVDVGQDGVEQLRTLDQPRFEPIPFVRCNDVRDAVQSPPHRTGPGLVAARRNRVVGDSVVVDQPTDPRLQRLHRTRAGVAHTVDQLRPVRTHRVVGTEHLVEQISTTRHGLTSTVVFEPR